MELIVQVAGIFRKQYANELQYYEEPTAVSGCAGVGIRGAVDAVVPVAAADGGGGGAGV